MADVAPPAGDRSASTGRVVVSTSLDDIRSSHVRFLQEAARLGAVHVRLPSDSRIVRAIRSATRRDPAFWAAASSCWPASSSASLKP